ncbi:PREDICTED: tetratricopeptide repeat protein 1 [Brassica oleracea var. oleracea]|uniref:tetratricopeptide repeat protein 1 n=1 Tax=Brassica oleracea var. oleracea TaxID=109376 RepID=UPI0006A7174B|nr:PREDICTED: tetratricopeptide repeat protein 1 [Brassica oleracea var. oleracea]
MVLIEQETLIKDEPNLPSSSSPQIAATEAKQVHDGDDSDGFETASEREEDDSINDAVTSQEEPPHQEKAMKEANEAKVEGNSMFVNGLYEEALSKYDLALELVQEFPDCTELRSICRLNRGVCLLKLGKYEETIKECTKALELNPTPRVGVITPTYAKALVRRSEAHEKLEHFEEAVADLKKILELDPSNDQARKGIRRLEPLAAEKREKMKEEAITKLKEMGNSILGRFGMSIDNFNAVRDPNTGSYSLSFQN